MWSSVSSQWVKLNTPWEAALPYMYTDAKGLVTTAVGNLIDSPGAAQQLPWKNPDGSPTSAADVAAAWNVVKQSPLRSTACAVLTTIRLSSADVTNIAMSKLASNWTAILHLYPAADSWPADAQFSISSMAWAMGVGELDGRVVSPTDAHFPQLHAALLKSPPDFTTAAANCQMQGVGISKRNAAQKLAFQNAAAVQAAGSDPSVLWYPAVAQGGTGAGSGPPSSVPTGLIVGVLLGGALWGAWQIAHGRSFV